MKSLYLETSDSTIPDHITIDDMTHIIQQKVLVCSLAILDPKVGHTMDILPHLSLSSVILNDSSTWSSVHVLMLSIQAMRGLPRLHAPGIVPCIVPCIISFSRQFPCFLMV